MLIIFSPRSCAFEKPGLRAETAEIPLLIGFSRDGDVVDKMLAESAVRF